MRVPQVNERIKEAPAQALRGVFAGIGQLLLITDKLRHKTPTHRSEPGTRRPEPAETATAAPAPKLVKPPQARDFDKTGNVRLLDADEDTATAAESPAVAERPTVAEDAPAEPGAPLADYDELSIAALHARLQNLDLTQVRELAEYERAHEARAEVIGMFERRIASLEAEG